MDTNKQKHLTKIILTVLTLSALVAGLNIQTAKATDYEWLLNGGFENSVGLDLAPGGSFSIYPNGYWNGTASQYLTKYHSASESVRLYSNAVWCNFSEVVPVASVGRFSFWMNGSSGYIMAVWVRYSDGSAASFNEAIGVVTDASKWVYHDVTTDHPFAEGKSIRSIEFSAGANEILLDDVLIISRITGQNGITTQTRPWYDGDTSGSDVYQTINNTFGHSGNCSYQDSFGTTTARNPILAIVKQDLNWIATANVTGFTMWAYVTTEASAQVTAYFVYSDGATSQKEIDFASPNQWTPLDFTAGITANKFLVRVAFGLTGGNYDGSKILIDDVSLTCNVPATTTFIEWSVTPEPLTVTSNTFSQYMGVSTVFLCTIYDINGVASENGTFVATSSLGQIMGTVSSGFLTFQMQPRIGTGNITETYTVQLFLDTRVVTVQIRGTWIVLEPDATSDTTGTATEQFVDNVIMYLVALTVVLLPGVVLLALKLGGFGFFAGLNVGVILAYLCLPAYVPIWGVVMIALVDALLLFGKVGFGGKKGD